MPGPCDNDQRSALAQAMDCARECLADLGATGYTEAVVVRTRTWSGPMGASTSVRSDVDVELLPRPRVSPAPPKHRGAASGKAADGERRVSGVSTRYTLADLEDAFLPEYTERFFLVGGKPYRLVTEPIEQVDGWTFDLRRMEGRSAASATESPPAAPVNLVPPTWMGTRGVGNTITLHPGTWSGNPSPSYTYGVSLGGSPVVEHVGTTWTDTEDTINQILIGIVTATNSAAPGGVVAATQPLGGDGGGACDCEALEAAIAAAEAARDQALEDLATAEAARDQALADLATAEDARDQALADLATAEDARDQALADLAVAEAALAVVEAERDALQAIVDAIPAQLAAAVAAERARALDWLRPGIDAVPTWTYSDPLGLLSAATWDDETGIYRVTAEPSIATPEPDTWAGWEGELYGLVDGVSFSTISSSFLARLCRNNASSLGRMTVGCDLRVGIFLLNGPRATATVGVGGTFRAQGAGIANLRAEAWILRGGVWASALATSNVGQDCVQVQGTGSGTTFAAGARWVDANARLASGSSAGTSVSSGNPLNQADWGTETWVAMLVGRTAGTGTAPNNVAETFQFQPVFIYNAPDWGRKGIVT